MRRALLTATTLVTVLTVAGCGGGSSNGPVGSAGSAAAHRLLVQTFAGHHTISSGVISLDLRVVPRGSSTIRGPIELAFGGPFANGGSGKLPESDFTISITVEGHRGALQVISVNGKGYITVGGQSYRMPSASYKHLESGFGSLASSGAGSSSKAGGFSSLGIRPLKWLIRPRVVGTSTVAGVATTRIRAGLDAAAMLRDLSRLLGQAGSPGIHGTSGLPRSIPQATQRSIAHALGSPSVDVWTGRSDRLIRRLTVAATVPVTGQTRTMLGGMRSAAVTLGFEYSHVNQPQTISAPSATKPYSVFRDEVTAVLQEIESALFTGTSTGAGTSTTPGAGTSTTPGAGAPGADRKYTQCITAARGDVAKMQKCSKLLATG